MASRTTRKAGSKGDKKSTTSAALHEVSNRNGLPRPRSIEDVYGGGGTGRLMKAGYEDLVFPMLQKRHAQPRPIDDDGWYRTPDPDAEPLMHEWKLPYGVRVALHNPLRRAQMMVRYPWYVTWKSPTSSKRLRKNFGSLPASIHFVATATQYVDPKACIVSRQGYDIPPKLRNKLPSPWKWCPCCMQARKFYRVYPEITFYALIRDLETGERKERKLKLCECRVCGITNQNNIFRRSNQYWLVRRFKPGARRARRKKR